MRLTSSRLRQRVTSPTLFMITYRSSAVQRPHRLGVRVSSYRITAHGLSKLKKGHLRPNYEAEDF
jgi:hypothetical protein